MIALFLMGFILISQFYSVTKPLIILSSVMLSTTGVLIGLMVFRMPFGIIMTGVGVISLAGVVVNNAIVLIDYIDILRQRDGLPRRAAIVRAGMTRFRPVMLTAITTILGLIPLAVSAIASGLLMILTGCLSLEEARREKQKILAGEDSRILSECVTCYACEEYCPNGNHPFYQIVELQEKLGREPVPYPITRQQVAMMDFRHTIKPEPVNAPLISKSSQPTSHP